MGYNTDITSNMKLKKLKNMKLRKNMKNAGAPDGWYPPMSAVIEEIWALRVHFDMGQAIQRYQWGLLYFWFYMYLDFVYLFICAPMYLYICVICMCTECILIRGKRCRDRNEGWCTFSFFTFDFTCICVFVLCVFVYLRYAYLYELPMWR